MTSPYPVWGESEYVYYFKTDFGGLYKVGFMEDYTIWDEGAYQFLIINEACKSSPLDPKLKTTIFCIIEAFFLANNDVLLYLCETGDGRQAQRNRLFIRWFEEYSDHNIFYFDTVEIESEGIDNFAAIIVQKNNPRLQAIAHEFHEVVQTLKDKPDDTAKTSNE